MRHPAGKQFFNPQSSDYVMKSERAGSAGRKPAPKHKILLHAEVREKIGILEYETDAAPVRRYHDFLCMLIERNPRWARVTERALNPVLGKSVVLYGEKVAPTMAKWGKRSIG